MSSTPAKTTFKVSTNEFVLRGISANIKASFEANEDIKTPDGMSVEEYIDAVEKAWYETKTKKGDHIFQFAIKEIFHGYRKTLKKRKSRIESRKKGRKTSTNKRKKARKRATMERRIKKAKAKAKSKQKIETE